MAQSSAAIFLVLCMCLGLTSGVPVPTSWCSWFSYSNTSDTAGYCHTNDNYLLAIPAQPTSWVAKTVTRAYGRDFLCSAYTTNATCTAQAATLACSWDGSQCTSSEASTWSFFARHAYLSAAPAAYLCPGSQAQQFLTCNAIGNVAAQCTGTSGCVMSQGFCEASFLAKMTPAQNTAWQAKFQAFDPSVHGSCASSCYLKQLSQCSTLKNATACGANRYCQYDTEYNFCSMNLYGSDAWGTATNKASAVCTAYNSSNTCTGPIGAIIDTNRINMYRNWTQAGDASLKDATCPL